MTKVRVEDLSVYKNYGNGSWVVAAIVNGFLETRVFYGYTKRVACKMFRAEMNTAKV